MATQAPILETLLFPMGLHVTSSLTLATVGLVRKFQGDGDVEARMMSHGVQHRRKLAEWGIRQQGHMWKQEPVSRRIKVKRNEYMQRVNPAAKTGSQRWAEAEQIKEWRGRSGKQGQGESFQNQQGWCESKMRNQSVWSVSEVVFKEDNQRFWGGVGMWPQIMFCWKRETTAIFSFCSIYVYINCTPALRLNFAWSLTFASFSLSNFPGFGSYCYK